MGGAAPGAAALRALAARHRPDGGFAAPRLGSTGSMSSPLSRSSAARSTRGHVTRAAAAGRWRPDAGWRDLLRTGRTPEDVLERLMADDPLRLRALAGQRIRASARFVDADRVVLRGLARIAHAATLDGPPRDRSWLVAEVDAAIDDVVAQERAASPGGEHDASPFEVLARPVGLDGRALRVACDDFNARPFVERIAFFSLFVEARSLDAAAVACSTTPTEVARRARRALDSMLDAVQEEVQR